MFAGRRSILVIEDDADVRESMRSMLEEQGYSVETSANGDEAWVRLTRGTRPPSLIVLDLKLPGRSGWQILDMLRQSTTMVNIPVVVVSGFIGFPPAGAMGWLKKPFKSNELLAVVRTQLH